MSFELTVKPLAEIDILEAYNWYNQEKDGLGDEFISELEVTLEFILLNPRQYQIRYKNLHMAKIHRFPFCVHYTIEDNIIFIHAVLNSKRDPKNWSR